MSRNPFAGLGEELGEGLCKCGGQFEVDGGPEKRSLALAVTSNECEELRFARSLSAFLNGRMRMELISSYDSFYC